MIRIIDDFLDESDIIKYTQYVKKQHKKQSIIKDEKITSEFWNKYQNKIGGNKGILSFVTVTNNTRAVGKHTDSKHNNEKFKILIYLNDVSKGGTIFYPHKCKPQIVQNKKNRLVIFDINIEHEGEKFNPGQEKIAIGFRLIDIE